MLKPIDQSLNTASALIKSLTPEQYCDTSSKPYHSSIAIHIRHVLDIYNCICDGADTDQINLVSRARNPCVECDKQAGLAYIEQTRANLLALMDTDINRIVTVSDDLGTGIFSFQTTLIGVLIQAQSHATHHFASIGYILANLGIPIPTLRFGVNPTTPANENPLKQAS